MKDLYARSRLGASMKGLAIVAVIVCLCCASEEQTGQWEAAASASQSATGPEETTEIPPCEPGTGAASVIPDQSPQDFCFPIRPETGEEPTERAHASTPIEPEYTESAMLNRVQGIVILEVGVRTDGTVAGARVLKGLPCGLEDKAREAVLGTEFVPGKLNGEPVDSVTTVSVRFTLSGR